MAQLKIQVLAIGAYQTGQGRNGQPWHRRTLQCFTGEIVGQVPYYGESKEELETMLPGHYMVDVSPVAGDRGNLEFRIGKATPVAQAKVNA